jgi:hypothetical protein
MELQCGFKLKDNGIMHNFERGFEKIIGEE